MTKDWYFFLQKGRADGPFTPEEMAKAIESGRLGPHDLVYKDGAEKWLPGHQYVEFRTLFKMTIKAEIDEGWVVLTKIKSDKGVNYLQKGPFPTAKIRELLKGGYIQYRDFIWKEGQLKWQRISSVEIFNPPPVQWQAKNKLPQDVSDPEVKTLSQSEVIFTKSEVEKPDQPHEVDSGEVYEVTQTDAPVARPAPRTPGQKDPIAERRAQERRAQDRRLSLKAPITKPSWRKRLPLLPIALIGLMIGIIVVTYLHRDEIRSKFRGKKVEIAESKPKVVQPVKVVKSEPAVAPAPPPPPAPPPEPVLPRVAPTKLTILFNGSLTEPQLRFATDASHHYSIDVKVVGQAGDILKNVSVFRTVTVRKAPGDEFVLKLNSLGLGDGPYRIEAESEGVRSVQGIRLGRKSPEFWKELAAHRKLISLPYQRERRRLVRASAALVKLAESLEKGSMPIAKWRQDMTKFRDERFDGVNLRKPQTLVFPDLWQDLADAHEDLQRSAADRSLVNRRKNEIKKLQLRVVSLSLFNT